MKHNDQCLSLVAGANLKRLIKKAGMKQEEAAEELGYSDARQIRRMIANGITKVDEIQRIADYFGVSFFDMFTPID